MLQLETLLSSFNEFTFEVHYINTKRTNVYRYVTDWSDMFLFIYIYLYIHVFNFDLSFNLFFHIRKYMHLVS